MVSNEQIEAFIRLCKQKTDNDKEVITLVRKRFKKAAQDFVTSEECRTALCDTVRSITQDPQNKFVHLLKFLDLLKTNDKKKRKKNEREHESDSSEPTAKRQKKAGNIVYSDGSESGPAGSENHKAEEKPKEDEVMVIGSDSDTEPLNTATDESKQFPKCDKKPKSEDVKKKQIESDSDTEPLTTSINETKEFSKTEKKPKSESPTAKELKSESPAAKELKSESPVKGEAGDQQLTILPLTPIKRSSPEKPDGCAPTSYKSPTARYKYCHVAELRLTDDDDKSSKNSVKKNSDDDVIMHVPRKKVARIVIKPLTPDKLPNGTNPVKMLPNERTSKHGARGDRSPAAAAAVVTSSPGPEYVFVSGDQDQQPPAVCEDGDEAADDRDCEVVSDAASAPDLDDVDASDRHVEGEEEEAVEKGEQEDEEDGPAPVKGSRKQLKKLEVLLDKISKEIRKLENRELTLEEMDDDDSAYSMEDRYKKKFCKVWDKYCEVAGRPPTTGRPTERKFRFEGTRYPEVNKKIERFVNVKQVFPDYHDIRDIIGKVNKKYHLHLKATAVDNLARDAFTVVGNELQKRRMLDFSTDFESRLDEPIRPYSDPALFDRGLRDKLEKNKKTYKSKMSEVLEKYARKQDDGDDADDTDEEEEGEEEEEEEAPSEDEAEIDIEKMFSLPITSLVKIKAAAESEPVSSTSRGDECGVSPEADVEAPIETPGATEQDDFMSTFGLQVRRQTTSPPRANKEVNLEDKQSMPQVSTDVAIDKKDKQSIPQVSMSVDIHEKDKQSIPQVSMSVDIDKNDKQSIPQAYKEVDLDDKDINSPVQIYVDLDKEDQKSTPQVYKELDIDDEADIDQNIDEDEENDRQVYKELDIDEEQDMDEEVENEEENERQVYKQLDIDEDMDIDEESDDDEENHRQVYKELDIDEKSEGGNSQHPDEEDKDENKKGDAEFTDGSQELFGDSEDNAVQYEQMENSPRIVPFEENSSSPFLYIEPDEEAPKSSNDTECGNSSSTEVFPGALTYIDVADEDSPDVNINVSISQDDVEDVVSSVIQLSDDPESKSSVSRRESIESLGSMHERTRDVKQGGNEDEQSDSDEQIYVERGTLSQPISIEDSQPCEKGDGVKDAVKTPDHAVSVGDGGKENGEKVSDHRKNRLKLPKHKTTSVCIAPQTVEPNDTTGGAFELGTLTFVNCVSDDDEGPIKTKTAEQKPGQVEQVNVSRKNTDISPHQQLSYNETRTATANVSVKQVSVAYTAVGRPMVKGPERGSPVAKNVTEAENGNRMSKTETRSLTPECKVKAPEKGSPTEPIDVDENEQEEDSHDTWRKGSESQPINVDRACSMDIDNVGLSATGARNPKGGSKPTTPPKKHQHSPPNNAVRISPEAAAAKSSAQTGERRKASGESERRDNTGTQQSKETQKRTGGSSSSDVIEIDDDSLVGSPEKIPAKLAATAAVKVQRPASQAPVPPPKVQRPTSQPPVPPPNAQTVDLTSPKGKKKFDPKATINIMNKVLAQSNANVPAVFTQTIADMISKVSAEVFRENVGDGKKQNNAMMGNQTSQFAGNRRQNAGAPLTNRAPRGANHALGGASRAPNGASRAPVGANHALGGASRAPVGVNRAPVVNRASGGAGYAPGAVTCAPGGANRAQIQNRAPVGNRTPLSPSQSDSRRRLNTNRVIPKSFQTNQAVGVQGPGQQKAVAYRNGVTHYAPANTRPQPTAGNPFTTARAPHHKGTAGPQVNNAAAAARSSANPQPLLLVQNTANVPQVHSNTGQNARSNQSVCNSTGGNQRQVVGNQRQVVGNQRQVVGNQRQLVGNQRQVVGNQRQVVGNQRQVGVRSKPVSPRSAAAVRYPPGTYTLNQKGVLVSPRSNRPVSASSMRIGPRSNSGTNNHNNNKHLSPRRLLYPGLVPSRQVVSGVGRGRQSEVEFQQSLRQKALTSTPRPPRSPNQRSQIAIGQEGGLKIMSYSSLATGVTVPVQSAQRKRPAPRSPAGTGIVSRGQDGVKKPKIETVVLSDSD